MLRLNKNFKKYIYKKTKKNGAFDDARQAKDDLNFDWRAICDRRLSCPTLLSPIILFHFRKL